MTYEKLVYVKTKNRECMLDLLDDNNIEYIIKDVDGDIEVWIEICERDILTVLEQGGYLTTNQVVDIDENEADTILFY